MGWWKTSTVARAYEERQSKERDLEETLKALLYVGTLGVFHQWVDMSRCRRPEEDAKPKKNLRIRDGYTKFHCLWESCRPGN